LPFEAHHTQTIHPDFEEAYRCFQKVVKTTPGGGSLCVYRHGERVLDVWSGTRNSVGDPMEADTLVMAFSAGKGIAALLLHILADRGLVDLNAPVCDVWPEFGNHGKQRIRIADVLTHRSGLWAVRPLISNAESLNSWQTMTHALANAVPHQATLGKPAYHAITFGYLVGEIICRITGMTFSDALRNYLADPAEIPDLYIGVPSNQLYRRAEVMAAAPIQAQEPGPIKRKVLGGVNRTMELAPPYRRFFNALCPKGIRAFDFNKETTVQASIPAANAFVTARSLAKMYAYLSVGGSLDGVRLVSQAHLDRMGEIQTKALDRILFGPLHWRMGFHRVVCASIKQTQTGYGHYGLGGSGGWCDPERGLAMALLVNGGIGTPLGDARTFRVSASVLKCADRNR
jgi:CubicO group peptidase (beta-lactamase class C family)